MTPTPEAVEVGISHDTGVDQTDKAYFLPSDDVEKARLAIQHSTILKSVGDKLVHAPVTLDEGSSVLESATGSGIWLQDLAKTVPATTELIGIDIEGRILPRPSTVSPNLQFHVRSVLDLPKEWTNKFDLVHQRLLCLGLRDAEWQKALGEIYRVLKPGGWFQWLENDSWEEAGPKMKIFEKILQRTTDLRGMEGSWPNGSVKWQRFVEEAKFVDVRVTWYFAPIGGWAGERGIQGRENALQFFRGTRKAFVDFGLMDEQECDKLSHDLGEEIDSRPGAGIRYIMICAQKPAE